MPKSEIVLADHQTAHFNRFDEILDNSKFGIDNSFMGSGKTIIQSLIAKKNEMQILPIGPLAAEHTWKKTAKKYGIYMHKFVSYSSLASTTGHQPSHGYLVRTDHSDGSVTFKATEKFRKLVQDVHIYLILDECHEVKNKNTRYLAVKALIDVFYEGPTQSRFALLSGSPIQEYSHVINYMRLVGFIKNKFLYKSDKTTKVVTYYGLTEFLESCKEVNPKGLKQFKKEHENPTSKNIQQYCYQLYCDVILPKLQSEADPPNIEAKLDYKNGLYDLPEDNRKRLREALDRLIIKLSEKGKSKKSKGLNTGKEQQAIELEKCHIFIERAKNVLNSDKKAKVLLMFCYTASIELCIKALKEFNPLRLDGSVKKNLRDGIVDKFNDNPENRLIIGNIIVMSTSYNFHDTTGEHRRVTFKCPTFRVEIDAQAATRTYRYGAMSDIVIRNVYVVGCEFEHRIIRANQRKSMIMKGSTPLQVAKGCIFPDDLVFVNQNDEIVEFDEALFREEGREETFDEIEEESEEEDDEESEEEEEESDDE